MGRIGRAEPYEHTFSSGNTAVIRDIPNIFAVFGNEALSEHLAEFEAGAIKDGSTAMAICREVVRLSLVSPRLGEEGETGDDVVLFEDLLQEEIDELVDLWQTKLERAARFRDERAGKPSGGDSANVGGAPKQRTRTSTRKR